MLLLFFFLLYNRQKVMGFFSGFSLSLPISFISLARSLVVGVIVGLLLFLSLVGKFISLLFVILLDCKCERASARFQQQTIAIGVVSYTNWKCIAVSSYVECIRCVWLSQRSGAIVITECIWQCISSHSWTIKKTDLQLHTQMRCVTMRAILHAHT